MAWITRKGDLQDCKDDPEIVKQYEVRLKLT